MKYVQYYVEIALGIFLCSILVTFVNIFTISPIYYSAVNSFSLFVVFALYTVLFKKKTYWIGLPILALTFVVIGLMDDRSLLFFSILFLFFAAYLFGFFWHKNRRKLSLWVAVFCTLFILFTQVFVSSKIEKDPRINFNLTHLQDSSNYLIGHQNDHPVFNQDTVYLVNFSFQNCLPCRFKKNYLAAIRENFNGMPFKIIEIHTFENKKIFDESYLLDYPFVYHDSLGTIAKLYAITGGPEELIFNKKGQAVRRIVGFGKDSAETYLAETKKLILELTR